MNELGVLLTFTGGPAGALVLGFIAQRLKLSPIIGYPLAGVAVGPSLQALWPTATSPMQRSASFCGCSESDCALICRSYSQFGKSPFLLSDFNDRIQSIQVMGGSGIQVFDDNDFSGDAARTTRDVPDLRSWRIPDDPSKNWGGRISSIRVDIPSRGRWSNRGGYSTSGYTNQGLIHCSSRQGNNGRQNCENQGYVGDIHMINSYGTCRKDNTWGIDNGRLWVSSGCSADFEVQR